MYESNFHTKISSAWFTGLSIVFSSFPVFGQFEITKLSFTRKVLDGKVRNFSPTKISFFTVLLYFFFLSRVRMMRRRAFEPWLATCTTTLGRAAHATLSTSCSERSVISVDKRRFGEETKLFKEHLQMSAVLKCSRCSVHCAAYHLKANNTQHASTTWVSFFFVHKHTHTLTH